MVTSLHDDPDRVTECTEKTMRDGFEPMSAGFVREIEPLRECEMERDAGVREGLRDAFPVAVACKVREIDAVPLERVGTVEFVGVGVRMCVGVREGVLVGVRVCVGVASRTTVRLGVPSSVGLGESVMISGGVISIDIEFATDALMVTVPVYREELEDDGVNRVAVSLRLMVTPLPLSVSDRDGAEDADTDTVEVSVTLPVGASFENDRVWDNVKSCVSVEVMVAYVFVGVGEAERYSESVQVVVNCLFDSVIETDSELVSKDVIVTVPVGVGGGVIVLVIVAVREPDRDASMVSECSLFVGDNDRDGEELFRGVTECEGDHVRLGRLLERDEDMPNVIEAFRDAVSGDRVVEFDLLTVRESTSVGVREPERDGVGGGVIVRDIVCVPISMVVVILPDTSTVMVKEDLCVGEGVGGGVMVKEALPSSESDSEDERTSVALGVDEAVGGS